MTITSMEQLREAFPARVIRCSGCGASGAWVDTAAGEITSCGEVKGVVSGPLLLLAGKSGGSCTYGAFCEDCREVE